MSEELGHVSLQLPVVVIVFRRPDLTRRIFHEVRKARPQRLFVIADGPRLHVQSDASLIREVRGIFEDIDWECDVTRIYADTNLGLRSRVISGLSQVFKSVDRALILEDDCLPSESLFKFSDELSVRFAARETVGILSANNFSPRQNMACSYYFSSHPNIWGWTTWSRTWTEFTEWLENSAAHLDPIRFAHRISSPSTRKSFLRMLEQRQELDSWALDFALFFYETEKLSAVPGQNLVTNIGFGKDSTHTKFESYVDEIPLGEIEFPMRHPELVQEDIREVRRAARAKSIKWFTWPLRHPLDFSGRAFRYLRLLIAANRGN